MLFVKRYLIIGYIKNAIKTVATVVFKILCLFHLQLTLLCAVFGCILEIAFGIVLKNKITFTIFHLIIALTIIYAIIKTLSVILGFDRRKKNKKKNTAEIVNKEPKKNKVKDNQPIIEEVKEVEKIEEKNIDKPKYFRVKQNPKYVMAEYIDRYELFYDTGNGYKYVRTDYKGE